MRKEKTTEEDITKKDGVNSRPNSNTTSGDVNHELIGPGSKGQKQKLYVQDLADETDEDNVNGKEHVSSGKKISPLEATMNRLRGDPYYSSYYKSSTANELEAGGARNELRVGQNFGMPVPGNLYQRGLDHSSVTALKNWLKEGNRTRIISNADIMTLPEKAKAILKYHLGMEVDTPSVKEAAERKATKLKGYTEASKTTMEKLEHEGNSTDEYLMKTVDEAKSHHENFVVSNLERAKFRADANAVREVLDYAPPYSDERIAAIKVMLFANRNELNAAKSCIYNIHKKNLREMEFDVINRNRNMLQAAQIGLITSIAEGEVLEEHLLRTADTYHTIQKSVSDTVKLDEYSSRQRKDLARIRDHTEKLAPMLYNRTKQSLLQEGANFFAEVENK